MNMAVKLKSCHICHEKYEPYSSLAKTCSPKCALEFTKRKQEREANQKRRAFNAETRRKKSELKTRREWLRETQTAFNAFIRERDRDKPCISCGATNADLPPRHGGQWDCGHYLTTGAHPELRFNEFNAHKQCRECNNHRS